jgi:3-methyl-2-oxobutanoate hydroxymethyltransferase
MNRISVRELQSMKPQRRKISMLTAYDFHSAVICDRNGVDAILVGDSLGRFIQGHDDNRSVTITEMMYHTRIVSRGVRRSFVVADMPFGSYSKPDEALKNSRLLVEQGGADAVLMEGRDILPSVRAVAEAGIPVVGMVGMPVEDIQLIGKFSENPTKLKPQYEEIRKVTKALEDAGCLSVVLRTIPASLAKAITRSLRIPTIGIGAGRSVDGQLLLFHDMMGIIDDFNPKHVKRYAFVSQVMIQGVKSYLSDVEKGLYPSEDHEY